MWEKFVNHKSNTIMSAAVILVAASVISKFLGFLRNALLADKFGASRALDIYQASFKIPDLIYSILVFGALSAGFIPVFVRYFERNREDAWKLASDTLNILFVFLAALSSILFLLAPTIMHFIVPGFNAADTHTAVVLTRIMLLQPIFLGLGSILGGVLQSLGKFLIYAFCSLFYNLGIILGIIFLVPIWGIYGLGWGVVLGSVLYFILFLITTMSAQFHYSVIFSFGITGIKRIMTLMVPRTLSLIITQINTFIITILASTLQAGSIAVFNFANDLQALPVGIFAVSLATAAFPTLSLHSSTSAERFTATVHKTLRQILFLTIPLALLFFALRAQIVRITLGYGHFNWTDTLLTVNTLAAFCFGIIAEGIQQLLVRSFFAMEDSLSPFLSGLASVAVNLALGIYFKSLFGVWGLALAFSIAVWVDVLVMFVIFYAKTKTREWQSIIKFSVVVTLIGSFAALCAHFSLYGMDMLVNTNKVLGIFVQLIVSSAIGVGIFFGLALVTHIAEAHIFLRMIKRKFFARRLQPEVDDPTSFIQ